MSAHQISEMMFFTSVIFIASLSIGLLIAGAQKLLERKN